MADSAKGKVSIFGHWRRVKPWRLLSGNVEESLRLRIIALLTLWVAALSVGWVGGSPWAWLGGGLAATVGHAFSWHRRDRKLGAWTAVMAVPVIVLALVMRADILAALDGNWLPLAHFLLLVQAIASFDQRSRTGLYASLSLSGTVLFFASQQAFDLSFGLFLLLYAGLLMAFLASAYVVDERARTSAARAPTATNPVVARGSSTIAFWSVTGAAVMALSVMAFLLLPRGQSNAVGYDEVVALPITGAEQEPISEGVILDLGDPSMAGEMPQAEAPSPGGDQESLELPEEEGPTPIAPPSEENTTPIQEPPAGKQALSGSLISGGGAGVVMHVRSPVVSYWRGQVFDEFDNGLWRPERGPERRGVATYVGSNPMRYTQTYFMHQAQQGVTFMGYHGLEVRSPSDTGYGTPLGKGFSYKVLSVQPDFVPEKLRQDRPRQAPDRYYDIPSSLGWMRGFADRLTSDVPTGFGKAVRIVDYLRRNARYDEDAEDQLTSSASLGGFLRDGDKGTSIDYATATVLLARAAGLPARLAVGYLPGERDLLSGAYTVRGEHAHAWAEISFEKHSWVPFDAHPHPDLIAGGRQRPQNSQLASLNYLFETSVGDELLRGAALAPSKLSQGVRDAFGSPLTAGMGVVAAAGIFISLVWLALHLAGKRRDKAVRYRSYTRLQGSGREEMLRIYRRVEKLLGKWGAASRAPQQTLGEYARGIGKRSGEVANHLAWFVDMARSAAYDPSWGDGESAPRTVEEARVRFASLRAVLG